MTQIVSPHASVVVIGCQSTDKDGDDITTTKSSNRNAWMPLDALRHLMSWNPPKLGWLYVMFFIEFAAFGMLIPVVPFFAMQELGCGPKEVGILTSAVALSQFAGATFSGRISDTLGRCPIIVFANFWTGLGYSLSSFVTTFYQFLALRVTQGLTGGTVALCEAYILDITCNNNRAAYIGLFGAVRGLSLILGPALGAALVLLGASRRSIFVVAACLACTSATIGFFYLEESLGQSKRRPISCGFKKLINSSSGMDLGVAGVRGLPSVWTCRFFVSAAQGIVFSTHAFLIRDLFGWNEKHFGMILFGAGCLGAMMQLFLFPRIVTKVGAAWTLCLGCAVGMLGFVMFPLGFYTTHLVAIACFVILNAHAEPSISLLIGRFAPEQRLGVANGVSASARSLALATTPLLAGRLFEWSIMLTYCMGSVFLLLAAIMAARVCNVIPGDSWSPVVAVDDADPSA